MNDGNTSAESAGERGESAGPSDSESGGTASTLSRYARAGAGSGALAGFGGGLTLVRGLRAIRGGKPVRGLGRLVVGGGLLALAARQRRSKRGAGEQTDVDQSDVVETSPDIESVGETPSSRPDHASGDEAGEVVDTGPAIEAVESDSEQSAAAEREAATFDRVGAAAFDEHTNEVPAPQQVFNQRFLSLDAEAVWGIRDDDLVVVSQQYDAIEDTDTIEYVASTQVDENRVLRVPGRITGHWDEVGGGMAVESGDDIVFATSDDPDADWQLLVVPAAWADELLGEDS